MTHTRAKGQRLKVRVKTVGRKKAIALSPVLTRLVTILLLHSCSLTTQQSSKCDVTC